VGEGVSAGIVQHGHLYHGAAHRAGYLAHLRVTSGGLTCPCGDDGCLQANTSDQAVLDRAGAAGRDRSGGIADLVQAATGGDRFARELLEQRAALVGLAVANLVDLFDPSSVILAGSILDRDGFQVERIVRTARERLRSSPAPRLDVAPSRFGPDLGVVGAGTLALQEVYSPRLDLVVLAERPRLRPVVARRLQEVG